MRRLLLTLLLGLSAVLVLGPALITFNYVVVAEQRRVITEFERDAFVIGGRSEEFLESGAEDAAQSVVLTNLITTYAEESSADVIVTDSAGIVRLSTNPTELSISEDFSSRPEIQAALAGNVTSGERWSDTLQAALVFVAVPVISGDTIYGTVRLRFSHDGIDSAVARETTVLWWVGGGAVGLSLVLSFVISTLVTRPLKRIEEQTNALAAGDFTARLPEGAAPAEIKSLTASFNAMAAKVESLVRQQRAFASDASHQLRTPLTALLLRLEHARTAMLTDPVSADDRLADAETEVARLNTIVEGLLAIARSEAGGVEATVLDVAVIARDRVESWRALAEEHGITIAFDGLPSAPARAISTAPEQVIDNYIDNAIAHSPSGTSVVVRVTSVDSSVIVDVIDSGTGLSAEQCERAFDRFWRADSTTEGTGLGLAIVKHLTELSGGTVSLAPASKDGGIVARATFPAV